MIEAPFPALSTARLRLREIIPADSHALFAIHGDPDTMRWFGNDPLPDRTAADKLVETFASWRKLANPGVRWGLQLRDDDTLIGTCGLFAWQRNWRKCAIGYELAPGHQRQGLMREALTAAISWGLQEMALNRIEAQVHPANGPSIGLLTRLGFVQEGRFRQAGYWGGSHHDMLQFGLLRSDWRP